MREVTSNGIPLQVACYGANCCGIEGRSPAGEEGGFLSNTIERIAFCCKYSDLAVGVHLFSFCDLSAATFVLWAVQSTPRLGYLSSYGDVRSSRLAAEIGGADQKSQPRSCEDSTIMHIITNKMLSEA